MIELLERLRLSVGGTTRVPGPELIPSLASLRDQTVALKLAMFLRGTFFISELRRMLDVAGIVPCGETMRILELLHCVRYEDMPKPLREQVVAVVVEMFRESDVGQVPRV